MSHNLEKSETGFACTVCLQEWRHKPRSKCPGLPIYQELLPGLAHWEDLFGLGLVLSDGQRPVAYLRGTHIQLYDKSQCKGHDMHITFDEGKYKFLEQPQGFDIWRVNGLRISVTYRPRAHLFLEGNKGQYGSDHSHPALFGLYQWKQACHEVAETFADLMGVSEMDDASTFIEQALRHRFYLGWDRIIKDIAPREEADLSRLMFASAQGDAPILHTDELYGEAHAHTRADLLKYHACRLYAANDKSPEEVSRWRENLASTVPNKALNKTLDKLPVAVSFRQITRLSTIALESPISNRLHLIAILCASDHHNWGLHESTVVRATPEMVQAAAQVWDRTLSARSKTRDIGRVMSDILDYPDVYHGDFLGLSRRSHEWHAQHARHFDLSVATSRLSADTSLAMPEGIDTGALEKLGVTLLRTAGDCYSEAQQMRHCVDTYASKAARGMCYLFHVEHTDQTGQHSAATVEVSPDLFVVQAKGPANARNAACAYGVGVLNQFCKQKSV